MFTEPLHQIVTPEKLREAALAIKSKATGLDKESIRLYREDGGLLQTLADEVVGGRYVPQPLERIELPKNDHETRPIALAAVRDKIVQKCLADAMTPHFDKRFSDRSYGYRPGKGTLRAINRCRDFIRRGYRYVYRTDIDNFFETIPHESLLSLLKMYIADHRIVNLLALFLKNGAFKTFDYLDHTGGVHQGDALSPLLSNIYLDRMDKWLEGRHIEFVRFADDFTLFFKKPTTHENVVPKLEAYLQSIGLHLEKSKSGSAGVYGEGFVFLGCRFHEDHVLIDNDRLQKKVSKLYEMAKKPWAIDRYVSKVNEFVEGLQRYYLKIILPDSPQFSHLESALLDSAARRFAAELSQGRLRYKKEALPIAETLMPLTTLSKSDRKTFAQTIVNRAKSLAKGEKSEAVKNAIGRKKQHYAKKFAAESTLFVETFGTSIGVSKNKIVLKQKGKIAHSIPKHACERIVIQTRGASLSTALVHMCAKRGISIDFIDGASTPYAMLYSLKQSYAARTIGQLDTYRDEAARLAIAKELVDAKLRNQRNYLKYLDKHHKEAAGQIEKIEVIIRKIKFAENVESLMGLEGSGSALYWDALKNVISDKIDYPGRITKGAVDPVNSALNYGYAILYGTVQSALIDAGLALHISYLHALDGAKPTLVFDMIEPFRTFVVDRTVFTMINREEPIRTDKEGKLTQKSRKLLAANIIERLGSYTRYAKASKKISTLIREQAHLFARHIDGKERFRAFIGRY